MDWQQQWTSEEFWWTAQLHDIERCLNKGADPNARITDGNTPIYIVTTEHNGNPDEIKALINGGTNPNVRDKDGRTPLHLAAEHNPAVVGALTGTTAVR